MENTRENFEIKLATALFKSLGESITLAVYLDKDLEEGSEFGTVSIEGDSQQIFWRYGHIPVLFAEFTQLIQEAEAMLPDFEDMSSEEKISSIEEIFEWWRREEEEE